MEMFSPYWITKEANREHTLILLNDKIATASIKQLNMINKLIKNLNL